MKRIHILFTSIGRRVELVQAFKEAGKRFNAGLKIYGADLTDTAPALFFCDERRKVCRINDPDYIPQLLSICRNDDIDIVIPTIDTDLLLLANEKERFEEIGTKVLISDSDNIRICRDKRLTADFFLSCGLMSPIAEDRVEKYSQGFPSFIKPLNGSSSIDAYKVNNEEDLYMYAKKIKDYIIQPFIEGTEYTVDIMCDFNGNPIHIIPRERIAVRSGEVLKTKIVNDPKIIEECKRLIAAFKPCGPMTVQLIQHRGTGHNYYIEINPRFGGGAPLSMKAGADSAEVLLKLLNGESIEEKSSFAAEDGFIFCRYDQSICVNEKWNRSGNIMDSRIQAVLFDLDDTLYSEKDYIRSGFKEVAKLLVSIPQAELKLWAAFEAGEQAIDYVLRNEGIYSDELRMKCIHHYRFHKPSIQLYDGIEELIKQLRREHIKIGIVTDGRPEGQRAKIESLGLTELADEIIITDELGGAQFRKPNDIAFRIMQGRFGVPYSNMIYIGDNPRKDFDAPAKLGMQACYFKNDDGLYSNNAILDVKVDICTQVADVTALLLRPAINN